MTVFKKFSSWYESVFLLWAIVGFGIIVRLIQFLSNRSLWLDEAAIAISIVNRTYRGLLQPLDYNHAVPPGFLMVERFFVELIGKNEYGLRMFPLIAGVGSIFLFWGLVKNVLYRAMIPIALLFFATSEYLIYYSSEVKQYSTDVFFALAVLTLAVYTVSNIQKRFCLVLLALVGVLAVWFSHPAVFVLSGVAAGVMLDKLLQRDYKGLLTYIPVFAAWSVSFAMVFFLIYRPYEAPEGVHGFWEKRYGFMPFPPKSISELMWLPKAFGQALSNPVGLTLVIPSAVVVWAGVYSLFKSKKSYFYMTVFIVLLGLAASGIRAMPFSQRLILYTVPFFLIALCQGLDAARRRLWPDNRLIFILIVSVLLYHPIKQAAVYIVRPITNQEIKPALELVEQQSLGTDVVFVFKGARKAYHFYDAIGAFKCDAKVVLWTEKFSVQTFRKEFDKLRQYSRAWILITHCNPVDRQLALSCMDSSAQRLKSHEKDGAWLYLYVFE